LLITTRGREIKECFAGKGGREGLIIHNMKRGSGVEICSEKKKREKKKEKKELDPESIRPPLDSLRRRRQKTLKGRGPAGMSKGRKKEKKTSQIPLITLDINQIKSKKGGRTWKRFQQRRRNKIRKEGEGKIL